MSVEAVKTRKEFLLDLLECRQSTFTEVSMTSIVALHHVVHSALFAMFSSTRSKQGFTDK